MENPKKNRIMYLDTIRFFCILIVFLHHFLMDVSVIRNMYNLNWLYILVFDRKNFNIGMCSIVLYFFVSGAAMMISSKKYIDNKNNFDIANFYKDRLIRLLIPFYITYFIYFVIRVVTVKCFPSPVSGAVFPIKPRLYAIIYTICGVDEYLNGNGIATFSLGIGEWFLGCIIFCYILFPFLYKVYIKKPKITFLLFTLYFFIIQFFLDKFYTMPHTNFFNHIYNFFLGMVLLNNNLKNIYDKYKKILIPLSILVLFLLIYINNFYILMFMNIKTTFASIFIYILFYYLENFFQKSNNFKIFIQKFTAISFEIILVHHSVIYEVDRLFGYKPVEKKLVIIILLDLILTYIFANLVHKINEIVVKKIVV